MEVYPITIDGEDAGTLRVEQRGARTVFTAECGMSPELLRISVYGGGKEGYLGVDHDCNINPLILKVECKVEGSFDVSYSSDDMKFGTKSKNSLVDYSNEWKTKEYKYEIGRHNWFKVSDASTGAANGGGTAGGGGGGKGW